MKNLRTYGRPPFSVAVIHGGPGAGGEMAPVARELGRDRGVLEPIQTATSLAGQIEELRATLEQHGNLPVILVGFSWGAWLSFLVAAHHPPIVRKLIVIGSGPFEEKYVPRLHETRMSRLSEEERGEFASLLQSLSDPATEDKDILLARLGALAEKSDSYDPIQEEPHEGDSVGLRGDIFGGVWEEATDMRRSGRLLDLASQIRCPVAAIHGEYDPHPADGVQEPLSERLEEFRFTLIRHCGHKPWIERQARVEFYTVLMAELS